MRKSVVLLFLLGSGFLTTFYTNCGPGNFAIKEMSSIGVEKGSSVDSTPASVLSLSTMKAVATGKCTAAIHLSADKNNVQFSNLEVPPVFSKKLYLDSSCTIPAVNNNQKLVPTSLPLDLYILSEELFQENFYVKSGAVVSNTESIAVYKANFSDVSSNNLGTFHMHSLDSDGTTAFSIYASNAVPIDSADIFNLNFRPITNALISWPGLLSSLNGLSIFEDGVYLNGRKIYSGIATSATIALKTSISSNYFCFSTDNKVYCGVQNAGSSFRQIALPEGHITDLKNTAIQGNCAVVSGQVYCWHSTDEIPAVVSEFGSDVLQISVSSLSDFNTESFKSQNVADSTTCALREAGAITCFQNGQKREYLVAGAVRSADLRKTSASSSFLALKKRIAGIETWHLLDLSTGALLNFPASAQFEDFALLPVYNTATPTSTTTVKTQGCGRFGRRLTCFKLDGSPLEITTSTSNILY